MSPRYVLEDTRVVPLYGVCASVLALVGHTLYAGWTRTPNTQVPLEDEPVTEEQQTRWHIVKQAGGVMVHKLARLFCCIVLFSLSCFIWISNPGGAAGKTAVAWSIQLAQCGVYAYASALALAYVVSRQSRDKLFGLHLTLLLLLTFAVYAYRDLVPLLSRGHAPADISEGIFLWVQLSVLFVAAVVLPLIMPRNVYNANGYTGKLAEQQSASAFSVLYFNWITQTVVKASRVSHLPLTELPSLADDNTTKTLTERSFPHIDPFERRKKQHIFWSLLKVFWLEYLLHAICVAGYSICLIAQPIAIKGLLDFLEGDDTQSNIYPWVWIAVLFFGRTAVTLFGEWYEWLSCTINYRLQAVLTEMLFEHALRIRVTHEASDNAGEGGDGASDVNKNSHLVGRLNNLITSDLVNIKSGNRTWVLFLVQVPVVVLSSTIFIYNVLGWSAFIGLGVLLTLLLIPLYLSSWIKSFQVGLMKKTDARVQIINEILNMVRMIKLFGWEQRVTGQVEERRAAELVYIRLTRYLELANNCINFSIPLFTMALTFAIYTLVFKGELTPARLFSTNSAFITMQLHLHVIFYAIPVCTQAWVSLDRLNDFLQKTELLDEFEEQKVGNTITPFARSAQDESILGIGRTTFTWAIADGTTTPATPVTPATPASGTTSRRRFVLNIAEEVIFRRGKINLILGPTGSGKTSLLMALLGEMHAIPSGPDSFVSLPREGGVAYAAQESWIQNETIRENILFGAPFDETRYNEVIRQCALERDLELFQAGDNTEVGEKGITLSGGQKARITLARAVYSSAEILLLDDVLAALDVHTGRWIVDKCFQGDLVRGRTIILVSHNVALTQPIAEFVVALGTDGRIVSQGTMSKALKEDHELQKELQTEEEELHKADEEVDTPQVQGEEKKDGKLIVAEEIGEGRVGWNAFKLYLMNTARVPWLYWAVYIFTLTMTHVVMNGLTYFLGYWASQYEDHDPSEIPVPYYVAEYCFLVLVMLFIYFICWSTFIYGSIRVSRIIHSKLLSSVLGTTLRWLDVTPTSRIIARCTADIQALDTQIARVLHSVLEGTVFMVTRAVAVCLFAPFFILPATAYAFVGAWLSRIYMHTQLCVKRELSNARAPVLGHFGDAITGLVSIRAYGAQEAFKRESYARMDRYTRATVTFDALNRWITMRMDIIGSVLSGTLAAYVTYVAHLSASNTGFSLFMAISFSTFVLNWMRTFNDFQVTANSLERVQQYLEIEQEPKPTQDGVPPAYWPASGDLRVEKLSARYSSDGPNVLHDLQFEVKSGERVGIVGRTGSGKSSLTLALLRCILTQGKVYYDGISTDSINLDALRSNITIIPQMPELLSGTLRQNLDPFGQHDDATLNDALRAAGLFSLQEETDSARITLDSEIAGGGGNLSVGQRQIIALARAMVRRSKLLILDEATSAIDYETDVIIQKSLREELERDVTVLTVAHRLQSIMDADKIMVLDAGRIVEYAKPSELLRKENGYFRSLVDGSGDRKALYAMAGYSV